MAYGAKRPTTPKAPTDPVGDRVIAVIRKGLEADVHKFEKLVAENEDPALRAGYRSLLESARRDLEREVALPANAIERRVELAAKRRRYEAHWKAATPIEAAGYQSLLDDIDHQLLELGGPDALCKAAAAARAKADEYRDPFMGGHFLRKAADLEARARELE